MKHKILLIWLILIVFGSVFVIANDYVIGTQFLTTNTNVPIGYDGLSRLSGHRAQGFIPNRTYTTDKIAFCINSQVGGGSDLAVSIQSNDAGSPSGTLLSENVTFLKGDQVTGVCNNITFSSTLELDISTVYQLVILTIESPGADIGTFITDNNANQYADGVMSNVDFNDPDWFQLSSFDFNFIIYEKLLHNPPLITNLILTSAVGNTNNTGDSTPTINITLDIDGIGCISNQSDGNYTDCVGRGGNCSVGEVNTKGICTLPENQSLTNFGVPQPLYFWANNSGGINHNVFNNSIDVTFLEFFFKLDGVEDNRTYEYQTTVNISTSLGYVTIYDDTNRYVNVPVGILYNYTIDLLRINKFSDTNITKNISSGDVGTINIDNRTDLYNTSFNITGYNIVNNIILNISNDMKFFPGKLLGNNLYQNEYNFESVNYTTYNLSYSSAGSKTIFINYSAEGNLLTRNGTLNFTITAFDADFGNDLDFTDNFSNNDNINITSLKNISAHMSVFDDLESDVPGRYDCTNISSCTSTQCVCIRTEASDSYWRLYTTASWGGFVFDSTSQRVDIDAPEITLSNISRFNMTIYRRHSWSLQDGHVSTTEISLQATDGTNTITLWSDLKSAGGHSFGNDIKDGLIIHGFKNVDGTWDIYENNTIEKNDLSLSSLNEPITLRFEGFAGGNSRLFPGSSNAFIDFRVYHINTSGIRLRRLNGSYESNVSFGQFISSAFTTTNNIIRAFMSLTEFKPDTSTIAYFLSNDDGATWESTVPNTFHTFSSIGNDLRVRFDLNSTDNLSSPFIPNYRLLIVPASPSGMVIDVGGEGISDMIVPYELNSTTTPIHYNGTIDGFNNYINSSCQDKPFCLIPIDIVLNSGGVLQISDLNATFNINPIRFNATTLQDLSEINIIPTYSTGILQFNDLKFDFRGSKNITVSAHTADSSNIINRTIFVKYSPFNLTFPSGVDYWEIRPNKANQSNLQPYGQTIANGIWQVRSLAYDGPMDIHVRYNNTDDIGCITINKFESQNFSFRANSTLKTLNITNLTTSNQILIRNLSNNISSLTDTATYANIWTLSQINCSENLNAFVIPYYCYNSLCTDCVITHDFQDDCQVIV